MNENLCVGGIQTRRQAKIEKGEPVPEVKEKVVVSRQDARNKALREVKQQGFYNRAYKELGLDKHSFEMKRVIKPPVREKAQMMTIMPHSVYQADLQEWNNDKGYRYLLVLVDVVSKEIDIEPLKSKTAEEVKRGFQDIFKRKIISADDIQVIYTDEGSEFKNDIVKKFMKDNDIVIRFTVAGRKRQNSVVEAYNGVISKLLAIKTTVEQQLALKKHNKVIQREWVQYIPKIRKLLNEKIVNYKPLSFYFKPPKFTNAKLLLIGQDVLIPYEKPKDVNENRLHGTFRIGDMRFDKTIYQIDNIIISPNSPVRYVVKNKETGVRKNNVAYLKDELRLV